MRNGSAQFLLMIAFMEAFFKLSVLPANLVAIEPFYLGWECSFTNDARHHKLNSTRSKIKISLKFYNKG